MSTEITNEEPVLVLNDKKYIISEMTDLQKAFVIELNALEQDINTTRRSLDRLVLAKEGYTSRLQQDLESPPETSEEPNEKPATQRVFYYLAVVGTPPATNGFSAHAMYM